MNAKKLSENEQMMKENMQMRIRPFRSFVEATLGEKSHPNT